MTDVCARIKEYIKRADNIAVVCHANPDGDTLGSGLALYYSLKSIGMKADIFCDDVPCGKLTYLPGCDNVRTDMPEIKPDLCIAVDCADIELIGRHSQLIKTSRFSVCIDHHPGNTRYAGLTWLEDKAAATAQTVYKLIRSMQDMGVKIDNNVAKLLYCALVTDSGAFSFSSVNSETLTIAADLIKYDIQAHKIIEHFLRTVELKVFMLKNRVLSKAKFYDNNRIAMIIYTREDFSATGTAPSDTEGIINEIRNINGVDVAVSLSQVGDFEYKVSFRTSEKAEANRIASVFGGGGHARAAGCRCRGYLEDVKEAVVKACRDYLC